MLCSAANIAGEKIERPRISASDVVFMYTPSDPMQYDAYAGTVAGWGGRPRTLSAADVEGFQRRVVEAQKRGVRYCASVDFLVDFGGFIDFRPDTFMDAVCRDLDGNPIRGPWLWDHKHKGHPAIRLSSKRAASQQNSSARSAASCRWAMCSRSSRTSG